MRAAAVLATSVTAGGLLAGLGYLGYRAGLTLGLSPTLYDKDAAEILKGNEKLFSSKDLALIKTLVALGQGHLFAAWPAPGSADSEKVALVAQLQALQASYPGGLPAYITNARKLLQDSKEGRNPFEGYTPSVPVGQRLDFASPEFLELEEVGLREAGRAAFVLVAGGLGERLGYSGIKVALPSESATGTCFLELYSRFILALQARSGAAQPLPFAIMTSDDTHDRTLELLEAHQYYGLDKMQVHLVKQEKVACLLDNAATLALDPGNSYRVQTKPHGHGDVHALLHTSGLARQWAQAGLAWVCFFQDTNAQVFRALTAALGVSSRLQLDMNSLCVPRKAKEAIGAIACLKHADGHQQTINVEYNQLDPLLRATLDPAGDVNDTTGFSPFPGNINQLVVKLDTYHHVLERTGGIISEFVNPKYKDAGKTEFKSSTRLECMMQDYPKALPDSAKVGFTSINQVWASYSPVKNNAVDARAKAKQGEPTHSATSAELDIYKTNSLLLQQLAGAVLLPPAPQPATFNAIPSQLYPRVLLSPSFAPVLADIKAKVAPGSISLAPGAVLVLDGPGISIKGPLKVAGALVIRAVAGAEVEVQQLSVSNAGWVWWPLQEGEPAREEERIRGFKVLKKECLELVFDTPGCFTVPASPTPAPPSSSLAASPTPTPTPPPPPPTNPTPTPTPTTPLPPPPAKPTPLSSTPLTPAPAPTPTPTLLPSAPARSSAPDPAPEPAAATACTSNSTEEGGTAIPASAGSDPLSTLPVEAAELSPPPAAATVAAVAPGPQSLLECGPGGAQGRIEAAAEGGEVAVAAAAAEGGEVEAMPEAAAAAAAAAAAENEEVDKMPEAAETAAAAAGGEVETMPDTPAPAEGEEVEAMPEAAAAAEGEEVEAMPDAPAAAEGGKDVLSSEPETGTVSAPPHSEDQPAVPSASAIAEQTKPRHQQSNGASPATPSSAEEQPDSKVATAAESSPVSQGAAPVLAVKPAIASKALNPTAAPFAPTSEHAKAQGTGGAGTGNGAEKHTAVGATRDGPVTAAAQPQPSSAAKKSKKGKKKH